MRNIKHFDWLPYPLESRCPSHYIYVHFFKFLSLCLFNSLRKRTRYLLFLCLTIGQPPSRSLSLYLSFCLPLPYYLFYLCFYVLYKILYFFFLYCSESVCLPLFHLYMSLSILCLSIFLPLLLSLKAFFLHLGQQRFWIHLRVHSSRHFRKDAIQNP